MTGDGLVASASIACDTLYSQRLLPLVDWLLGRAGIELRALRGMAVSLGPGSFTGLRVGLSTAKGLAYALGIPLVGIPTLEALALRAASPDLAQRVVTLLDARQRHLYMALYEIDPPSKATSYGRVPTVRVVLPPCLGSFDDLSATIDGPAVFAGDAALRYRNELAALLGDRFQLAPLTRALPSAEEVALLGALKLEDGCRDDLASLEPIYLRQSYADPARPERS